MADQAEPGAGSGWRARWPLWALIAATVLWQLPLALNAVPAKFDDTESYRVCAHSMLDGTWTGFHFRTPGYPAMMAAVYRVAGIDNDTPLVWLQFLMGSAVPLLLYRCARALGAARGVAALAGGAWLLDEYSVMMQSVLMTESPVQVAMVGVLAFQLSVARTIGKRGGLAAAAGLGVAFAWLVLLRPSMQLLPHCALGGLALWQLAVAGRAWRAGWKPVAAWCAVAFLCSQAPVWAWAEKVRRETGTFTLSTQLGAALMNHAGAFVEEVPDAYEPVKGYFIEAKRMQKGDHVNAQALALWMLARDGKMEPWDASAVMMRMSKHVLARHPAWYARRVVIAAGGLWGASAFYLIENAPLRRWAAITWPYGPAYKVVDSILWRRTATRAAVALLFAASVVYWAVRARRARDPEAGLAIALLTGFVAYNLAIHALFQYAEFGRYRLPTQPLHMVGIVSAAFQAIRDSHVRGSK